MQRPIDTVTLVLVLAAGIQLGLLGFFGFDAALWVFGSHTTTAYQVTGASAVWQLMRQRFV
jgi:uncharacterized membrane protein YuzA (DUF378 family)